MGGPKVCWKFNDPPGYVRGLSLKSSGSVFSVYLYYVERAVACKIITLITSTSHPNLIISILMVDGSDCTVITNITHDLLHELGNHRTLFLSN